MTIQKLDTIRITVELENSRELNTDVTHIAGLLKCIEETVDADDRSDDTYIDGLRVIF